MRFVFLALFVLAAVSCQPRAPLEADFLFNENSVGPIKIGDTRGQVVNLLAKQKWKEENWVSEETGDVLGKMFKVYKGDELLFLAEIYKGVVYRLVVISHLIRTREGLGVGSTLGQIKREMGTLPELATGEDGLFAIFTLKGGRLSFALDNPEASERYATYKTLDQYASDERIVRYVLVLGP